MQILNRPNQFALILDAIQHPFFAMPEGLCRRARLDIVADLLARDQVVPLVPCGVGVGTTASRAGRKANAASDTWNAPALSRNASGSMFGRTRHSRRRG
jgi:hypothetical protein